MNRSKNITHLQNESFDVLVIGGGVTGAGIALDAASRGLKTALVEKEDFASGTSSRSTKLVHGGLRYLKQFEIGLVMEVGRERAIVHRNAPHLVIPEKMLMPIIKDGTYGMLASNMGLAIYDLLAGVRKQDRRSMLKQKKALTYEPLLNSSTLKGAGLYSEYRTDDARLTIELIKTATRYGATCANYCTMIDFVYGQNRMNGIKCKDEIRGDSFIVKAKTVINASGPWVDDIRRINGSLTRKQLHLTKGVHLVVDHQKLPVRQSVYFDVPDGRMIFAIPRGNKTYFGTTDTDYSGDKNDVRTSKLDAEYLIHSINQTFPSVNLSFEDIESSWAGLRPLIHQEGRSASEISRKDEVFVAADGLISIAGGKLTGYRVMAKKAVDLALKGLRGTGAQGHKDMKCVTREIRLSENPLKNEEEVLRYTQQVADRLSKLGMGMSHAEYLVSNYGTATDEILEMIPNYEDGDVSKALIRAELKYCADNEMITNLVDFFDRRTGRLSFDIESVMKYQKSILQDLSNLMKWTPAILALEQDRLKKKIQSVTVFS